MRIFKSFKKVRDRRRKVSRKNQFIRNWYLGSYQQIFMIYWSSYTITAMPNQWFGIVFLALISVIFFRRAIRCSFFQILALMKVLVNEMEVTVGRGFISRGFLVTRWNLDQNRIWFQSYPHLGNHCFISLKIILEIFHKMFQIIV